jgi:hypothetical protein
VALMMNCSFARRLGMRGFSPVKSRYLNNKPCTSLGWIAM